MNDIIFLKDKKGVAYSQYPPTLYLTFDYYIYLVPQYKPKNVLMLGYGLGTVAGLIRLLYGDIPITAIDTEPCPNYFNVELIQSDAKEFVKTCGKYDTVIIDLFSSEDANKPCDFVSSIEFVEDLKRIANYITINTLHIEDMSAYNIFRKIGVNKASGSAGQVMYFEVAERIPNLHPFK